MFLIERQDPLQGRQTPICEARGGLGYRGLQKNALCALL
jgi:hypothetical protein